jgi:hypothetical protein
MYGIYSSVSKKFVFDIQEPTKTKAWKALKKKIGNDFRKWRFDTRKIPKSQRGNDQMTEQNPTRVVTNEVRFSYVNLLKPRASQLGGEPKYSVTLLIPKNDVVTKQRIDAAIEAAKQKGKAEKWNGVIPPQVAIPIHDGDGVKPSDGMPFGPECKGHWVLSASTGVDFPPKIVDANLNPIIDATEVYSGMYGQIAVNFSPYANAGKKGVGCYISTNVRKTRDGEPLGASAPDAASDFGGAPQASQQPYGGQQYQPQTYQHYQTQHQPGQVYPAAQPQYQAPQYQPPAQPQQPQIDPITGLPINGGVYGI